MAPPHTYEASIEQNEDFDRKVKIVLLLSHLKLIYANHDGRTRYLYHY